MTDVTVWVVRCDDAAKPPRYKTEEAAGCDLTSIEEVNIPPGEWRLVRTGLKLEIPRGYEGQVRPRSGLALKHGITVLNSPGTIDSDYRGEVCVILFNVSKYTYPVKPGESIAQMVIAPVNQVRFEEVDVLGDTARGAGGFGSTGQ